MRDNIAKDASVKHTCHLLPVTCHKSLTPTATAMEPPPTDSPAMHSKLAHKDSKTLVCYANKIIEML